MEGEEEEGQEPRRERKEELGATAAPRGGAEEKIDARSLMSPPPDPPCTGAEPRRQ